MVITAGKVGNFLEARDELRSGLDLSVGIKTDDPFVSLESFVSR